MASGSALDVISWTSILYLKCYFIFRVSLAIDITARRSFARCYHGNAVLSLYNIPLDKCMFECKIRSACDVMQYWRMRRECEMLTSEVTSDVGNAMGQRKLTSCVRIRRQDMTSASGLFDQCSQCSDGTVCDTEQGTCTIKECTTLRVKNGTVQGNLLTVGAKVTIRCNIGFHVENLNGSVHCLSNGTWSSTPVCVQNVHSCDVPVALVTGEHGVPDDAITASSEYSTAFRAAQGRLDNAGAWAPYVKQVGQYWQVLLPSPRTVVGMTTQGYIDVKDVWMKTFTIGYDLEVVFPSPRTVVGMTTQGYIDNDNDEWVETFTIRYSSTTRNSYCSLLVPVLNSPRNDMVFKGNTDRDTHKNNTFYKAVHTRCVRVYPMTWEYWPTMRIELWGCFSP